MGWTFSRRKRWSLLFLVAAVLVLFLVFRPSPRMEMYTSPPPPRKAKLQFLGQWMWPVKRQLYRVKQAIWGAPQVVRIISVIAEFDPEPVLAEFEVVNGITNAATGDRALVVRLERAQRQIFSGPHTRVLSQPGIVAVSGAPSQIELSQRIMAGASPNSPGISTGTWLSVTPRVRSDGVMMTCFLTQSELRREATPSPFAHTNAAFGASVHLPTNTCLLLVSGSTNSRGRVTGVYLCPVVEPKK
jgi:hypothetical protein